MDTNYARVHHLLTMLYDLKQFPRGWHLTLVDYRKSFSYNYFIYDHFVIIYLNGILISIYLDDLVFLWPHFTEISQFKKQFGNRIGMKNIRSIF